MTPYTECSTSNVTKIYKYIYSNFMFTWHLQNKTAYCLKEKFHEIRL